MLEAIATVSPLPVPEPVFVAADPGCLAYHKVPGVPLLHVPARQRADWAPRVATMLGEFLSALHAAPVERMRTLVGVDDQPLEGWRDDAADLFGTVAESIPEAFHPAIGAFLDAPLPPAEHPLVFSHNDLGIEHVLVDPDTGAITGVIDWSDAAIVDPAYDIGLIYRDLGPAALEAALSGDQTAAGGDAARIRLVERAAFYARCSVLEDLDYGLRFGWPAYVEKSLDSLAWLFPRAP